MKHVALYISNTVTYHMEEDSILPSYILMMKKLLSSAFAVSILCGGFFAVTSAHTNNDCKEVQFDNGTVCVSINKVSTDRFELITDNIDGSVGTLRCDLMTPDSALKSIPACNGTFTFDDNKSGRIKLRIRSNESAPIDWTDKPSNTSARTYPQWMYDFSNESWMDSNNNGLSSNNNNSNGDLNNFYLSTSDSSPSTNQYVSLTVKALDSDNATITDYSDTVKFKVYYRSSSSSSWTQTTSSSYYTISSSYVDGYDFTSSNNGQKTFSSFIKFAKNNYEYKVRVYAENDSSIYKEITFNVGSSSNNSNSNGDLNNFYLTTDDASPSTYQYVDLNMKARDSDNLTITDYSDTVKFKVYYGHASSSSWTQTTSSSYYAMASDYNTNGYDFSSSDNGYANLSNFIEFKNSSYDYKVRVYDVNDSSIYKEIIFYVNGSSNNNNNNNSNGDLNNFYLTTDDSSPSTYQYVDLNVKARDSDNVTISDYSDTVKFKVYYGHADSSSWTQTTSSSYYAMASDYNTNGYDFSSSDNGYANLSNFIEFKNSSYDYKVRVYDVNDSSIYKEIIFYVNGSSSNNNNSNGDLSNFALTTDDSSPSTYQYVDLNINARDSDNVTISNFSDTVKFKVYYGHASSSSWTQTTSSSYYAMASDYNTNGYDFTSSDDGYANISNFIEFKNSSYDYKVRVYDVNDSSIYKEIIFYVNGSSSNNNSSSVNGFSSTELDTVQSMHNARPNMISDLKAQYSKLKNSTTWKNRSDTFYSDMSDILDNVSSSSRTYADYDAYYAGFLSRYRYTLSIR
ncbi:MAG: hypothetical protein NTX91_02780 [candidate division SR1 bacterium]|nr:hypothetical protein [candidate division SR1 bacterium]